MEKKYSNNYYKAINDALLNSKLIQNSTLIEDHDLFYENIVQELKRVKKLGGNIYFFGNGASAAFSNHMALDFSKNGKIVARSLSDSAYITALANDISFENVFTEFLKIENAGKNDLIITISSSGNSPNIASVLEYCQANGITTVGLSGLKENNKTQQLCNYSIYVGRKTYGIVECVHQIILHLILDRYMEIYDWERNSFQNMNIGDFNL